MTVTIRNIAKHLNLSVSTVSKALNDYADVAATTRQSVHDAAREMGYYPSDAARSLRRRRTDRIGLLVPPSVHDMAEYFSEIILGVTLAAAGVGTNLMLYSATTDGLKQLTRLCRAREVDGVILISAVDETISFLKKESLPFVIIGHPISDPEVSFVASDNLNGNLLATRHLLAQGHQRIAYLASFEQPWVNEQRILGYKKALEEAGLPLREELIISMPSEDQMRNQAISKVLGWRKPPTAIVAFNDQIAINTLQVALKCDVDVPRDLAIVGYNDIRSSLSTIPMLTSVHQPLPEMGKAAVKALLKLVSDKGPAVEKMVLPVHLVVRQST